MVYEGTLCADVVSKDCEALEASNRGTSCTKVNTITRERKRGGDNTIKKNGGGKTLGERNEPSSSPERPVP